MQDETFSEALQDEWWVYFVGVCARHGIQPVSYGLADLSVSIRVAGQELTLLPAVRHWLVRLLLTAERHARISRATLCEFSDADDAQCEETARFGVTKPGRPCEAYCARHLADGCAWRSGEVAVRRLTPDEGENA